MLVRIVVRVCPPEQLDQIKYDLKIYELADETSREQRGLIGEWRKPTPYLLYSVQQFQKTWGEQVAAHVEVY